MKNILLVIDNLGSGGAQNQLSLLAVGLKERGYKVIVFTYFKDDFFNKRLLENDIEVLSVLKKGKLGLNVIWNLRRFYIQNEINIVISFLITPNFYSVLAAKWLKRKPLNIISYRALTHFDKLSKSLLVLQCWTNRNADVIVANSHHERKRWTAYDPVYKNKWHTIHNGIPVMPNQLCSKIILNSSFNKSSLICVGSVSYHKNGLCIVEAMGVLKKANKLFFKLSWIGRRNSGIRGSEDYALKMDKRIQQLGLSENWQWVGQIENVSDYYRSARALILASGSEGLPNVACEAQMAGCPVIISDVLDHSLIIEDNATGFLFDPNSPQDLAEKLLRLYGLSEEAYNEMRINSSNSAIKRFGMEKFVTEYIDLFGIGN